MGAARKRLHKTMVVLWWLLFLTHLVTTTSLTEPYTLTVLLAAPAIAWVATSWATLLLFLIFISPIRAG